MVNIARSALAHDGESADCPSYLDALQEAVLNEPPPYGTPMYSELYREASESGQWLAISLMANAQREGDGATRLWSLAAFAPDPRERQLLKRHAVDEASHSRAYLALLDLTFPGAVDAQFRTELRGLSPRLSMRQKPTPFAGSPYARIPSTDDFVQMNIAEIRTAIHHRLQRQAINRHCPEDNLPAAKRLLDRIYGDELAHVAYSARVLERRSRDPEAGDLRPLFCKRVCDFNNVTRSELGQAAFHCSCRPLE